MYPFIHIGHLSIGTFGILLWFAAVGACWILYLNFRRFHLNADAISIVAVVAVSGIIGAKLWHVLEHPVVFFHHPFALLFDRAGFAWYGGLLVGIAALLWQGRVYKIRGLRMLDLAAPSAAIGYGLGRLGCLISGDGDYGKPTHLPWGIAFPHGLVPTTGPFGTCAEFGWPSSCRVQPTPIYELIVALFIAWILWRRSAPGSRRPLGQITGEYLILSGIARFLVEIIRINPHVLWGMSNAQVASLGSIVAGILFIVWARHRAARLAAQSQPTPSETQTQPT
jgi:phosphatidylglycerol:prolipoprotein diacylglycerol transferase